MEYKQITLTEIYIPICFYFNAKSFVKSSYVLLFTFQYVSILIDVPCRMTAPNTDLHSNMFLF